jgi:hypothetical protein
MSRSRTPAATDGVREIVATRTPGRHIERAGKRPLLVVVVENAVPTTKHRLPRPLDIPRESVRGA